MDFDEAARRYTELRAQWQSGQLSAQAFSEAVAQLRTQDASGRWWQVDANTGSWLTWNGSAWVQATPPTQLPPPPPPTAQPVGQRAPTAQPSVAGSVSAGSAWEELKRRTLSPRDFLSEARQTPLARRSQRWWDAASVFGGATGGVLWFLYASIRGVTGEGLDLLTPLIMVLTPIGIVLLRSQIDKLLLPLQKYRQRVPRLVLVGAGIAAPFVIAWMLYGRRGLTMYPYLRTSVVISTIVSYLILRTPRVPRVRLR